MPTSPKSQTAPRDSRTANASRPAAATTVKEQLRALQTSMDMRQ